MGAGFQIRPLNAADTAHVATLARTLWGDDLVVVHGVAYQLSALPGLIAEADGETVGLLTYAVEETSCEVVSLDSLRSRQGIGRALLDALQREAQTQGWRRLWLITTNDNLPALRFYQKYGFRLCGLAPNAVAESRTIKPAIPLIGHDGIPIRDELRLELLLDNKQLSDAT